MDRAERLTGSNLGVYQVEALIGAGAMGEVYRARDTKLGRTVAIKVLPDSFTDDPERLARFEREARALAALNHPNIATIHGLEDFESVQSTGVATIRGLVLELVEGETLDDRIRSGLTCDQALELARQIADALDAAHEKGIVHRDLKPANVRVTPEGTVKVVDFGLAKLIRPAEADQSSSLSTVSLGGTREGVVVGTAAYMSPEQARGLPVDRRTDIWAFGCVLYEMLTARRAFARDTIGDTVAAVLNSEPDWSAIPDIVPPPVRRVLRRCLEKDIRRRARDIGDVRMELDEAAGSRETVPGPAAAGSRLSGGRPWVLTALGVLTAAAIAWAVWLPRPGVPIGGPMVTRTTLTLPPDHELDTGGGAGPLAISPDGQRVAYVATAGGRTGLMSVDLDAFGAQAIPGTEGAQYPFFAPDGEWVAFFADRKLKRVSIRGGSPLIVCDAATVGRGGTWGADGTIVFDPGPSGLMRVAATGGTPQPVTSRDPAMDRRDLSWPQFLPDGRGLLVTVRRPVLRGCLHRCALDRNR